MVVRTETAKKGELGECLHVRREAASFELWRLPVWAPINSNDFGRIPDSNSNCVVVQINYFKNNSIFCVFGVRSRTM